MKLPERVATIVIGNPLIADASLQSGGILVITGKGYGTTNLLALDRNGSVVMDKTVQVLGAAGHDLVVVYKGTERESYSCAPECEPRITLGDSQGYFNARARPERRAHRPGADAALSRSRRHDRRRRPAAIMVSGRLTATARFHACACNNSTTRFCYDNHGVSAPFSYPKVAMLKTYSKQDRRPPASVVAAAHRAAFRPPAGRRRRHRIRAGRASVPGADSSPSWKRRWCSSPARRWKPPSSEAGRLIMTGQAQTAGFCAGQLQDRGLQFSRRRTVRLRQRRLCQRARPMPVSPRSTPRPPVTNGQFDTTKMAYTPGGPGDIVVVPLYYQWPIYVSLLSDNLSNLNGNYRLLVATSVFRNEPYR